MKRLGAPQDGLCDAEFVESLSVDLRMLRADLQQSAPEERWDGLVAEQPHEFIQQVNGRLLS